MAKAGNPFTPTFGIVPPYLAGRDRLLAEMGGAFDAGLGDPNLCTLIVGPRGSGKTALLSCIGDEARERGWIVVDAMAEDGMLEDILQHAAAHAAQLVEPAGGKRLTGLSVGDLVGLEWETVAPEPANWRMRMESLLAQLSDSGTGLLITVDEVRADVGELVRLASSYQLFVRAGFTVALVMAGLPANVGDLVDDERVSFLRRARRRDLELIGEGDVARAFRKTIERSGKAIGDEALGLAVEAAGGFAYLIQLVGYFSWAESDGEGEVTAKDVNRGARAAKQDFQRGVLDRTWREMSKGDRAFALAMLPDENGSTLTEVAARMGRGTNYASTYKKRLMRQGVIGERAGNTFDFDVPMMRKR